jgi:hypothetical protein
MLNERWGIGVSFYMKGLWVEKVFSTERAPTKYKEYWV